MLESLDLSNQAVVVDPWNGAGTTSQAASDAGLRVIGFDINPAMVVVAKARLLTADVSPSLRALGTQISDWARAHPADTRATDPLGIWFAPTSAQRLRAIESSIRHFLTPATREEVAQQPVDSISPLAAFFFVALFRTTRRLLGRFLVSNPTWVTAPASLSGRIHPSPETIHSAFVGDVKIMVDALAAEHAIPSAEPRPRLAAHLSVENSRRMPVLSNSVDAIVSSPPYCTRLDYAVATRPELAVLGYGGNDYRRLRETMLGTAVVAPKPPMPAVEWGPTCAGLLDRISRHQSKASSGYYLKTHLQYFDGLSESMAEVSRVLKPDGRCVLVVQDSHYKDIHNDLPRIAVEMAEASGLRLTENRGFPVPNLLATMHPHSRRYRDSIGAVESVLSLRKSA